MLILQQRLAYHSKRGTNHPSLVSENSSRTVNLPSPVHLLQTPKLKHSRLLALLSHSTSVNTEDIERSGSCYVSGKFMLKLLMCESRAPCLFSINGCRIFERSVQMEGVAGISGVCMADRSRLNGLLNCKLWEGRKEIVEGLLNCTGACSNDRSIDWCQLACGWDPVHATALTCPSL